MQVAILCNHQRSVPKGHGDQMQRMADKLQTAQAELDDLTLQLKISQGKAKAADAKQLKSPEKKIPAEDMCASPFCTASLASSHAMELFKCLFFERFVVRRQTR